MALMHVLRALSDLGLYYAFAGTVAGALGASWTWPLLLVQSGCYALSAALRRWKWARLAALAPAAAMLLLPGLGGSDRILALPALADLVYLAWREDYELRWERQADVFSLLWKGFLIFAPVSALFGCHESVVTQGMPAFLTAAAASVLLLRSVRHGPAIYRQRAYQLRNWLAVAWVLLCAYLAGTDWFLRWAGLAYDRVVLPALLGIVMVVGMVCLAAVQAAVWLIRWIFSLFERSEGELPGLAGILGSDIRQLQELTGVGEENLSGVIMAALGILAAGLAAWWLLRPRPATGEEPSTRQGERTVSSERAGRGSIRLPNTWAGRVRAQYRQFLKLCRRRGVDLSLSDTSAEVRSKAARRAADWETLADLRELEAIYRRARYNNQASREDLAQAKRLCGRLKRAIR